MHKSLNRLFDIESGRNVWCEADMWGMIKNIIKHNPDIKNYIANAISRSMDVATKSQGEKKGAA